MSYSDTIPDHTAHSREGSVSLVAAIAERSELQEELYLRFRRPLLQVFQQRRIDPDAAQDLLQRTFLQAIKKIRSDGLQDPSNLGGYLYRTATKLAASYWRGELAHQHDNDRELMTNLRDEALSLEERIDHDILARSVRELIEELPGHPTARCWSGFICARRRAAPSASRSTSQACSSIRCSGVHASDSARSCVNMECRARQAWRRTQRKGSGNHGSHAFQSESDCGDLRLARS
jgi:DNA-directed RNA polymerase specialized sigma24 family protein